MLGTKVSGFFFVFFFFEIHGSQLCPIKAEL